MNRAKPLSFEELLDLYPDATVQELQQIMNGVVPKTPASSWGAGSQSVYDFIARPLSRSVNSLAEQIALRSGELRRGKMAEIFSALYGEHMREYVATKREVDYINDSHATNVNATWFTLDSMDKPTVLLLGGQKVARGKEPLYGDLITLVKEKVTGIIAIGQDYDIIRTTFKGVLQDNIIPIENMHEAVRLASKLADPHHTVLLSPAAASFDRFHNYEDRGMQFKKEVNNLADAA